MTEEELEKEAYEFLIQVTKKQELLYFGGRLEKIVADFAEPREKRIAELEKENRDLKTDLELERKNKTNVFAELNDETARSNSMLMEELAEAKEIIKKLLSVTNENGLKVCGMYGNQNIIRQAEDFIKE